MPDLRSEPRKPLKWRTVTALPYPVHFRYAEFGAGTEFAPHRHDWGQLNYVTHGVMQLEVGGRRFLSPPHYAVWIPPGCEHSSYNRHPVVYRAVDLDAGLCGALPVEPCTLAISPLLRAILVDFAERDVATPATEPDRRLAQVLLDQLAGARCETRYLPQAESPALAAVLDALQADPGDNRSLADWAATLHTTERTLARLCQRELGMGLGEWRQRLRFLRAVEALGLGQSVQAIAFDLGYGTASAFIAMFQRLAGMTPEQYRRRSVL
ncbi:AraC family transcriptional regulator [Chitinimonas koreensis]|uniref:AraC family transcriptional regulator n=1 Tax=Chitinimonas koreensis TaxID=356302 RepID=UPI00041D1A37|nr:helix-turn-helix transcriptional regulator [Chitinimonas koreensis]QNM98515.1 helix-turn-helix transcriptional regulator [Chitinimonas koreensis]